MKAGQAASDDAELQAAVERMKGQLLIVLVNRLGGEAVIPVAEVDDTGGWVLTMEVDHAGRAFHFKAVRKI